MHTRPEVQMIQCLRNCNSLQMKLQLQENTSLFDSELRCPFFVQMMKLCERATSSLPHDTFIHPFVNLRGALSVCSPSQLNVLLPFFPTFQPSSSSEPCWTIACWMTTVSCTKKLPTCWGSGPTRRPSSCWLTGTKLEPRTSTATPDRCWQLAV